MPINRLLANTVSLDDVKRLNLAFERALHDLQLVDRNDPLTDIVAQKKLLRLGWVAFATRRISPSPF